METPSTVVIGVSSSRSKATQGAVKWVMDNNPIMHDPDHPRIILIHVIPPITSIPTPLGKHISVMEMDSGVVSLYRQDMISKCDEIFLPFKRLCKTREVETLVLEDENPAYGILRYVSDKRCKSLVLGYSWSNYISRKLKVPDVPSTVLKFASSSCNIYLISRNKLLTKLAISPSVAGSSTRHYVFTQAENGEGLDITYRKVGHCDSVRWKLSTYLKESSDNLRDMSLEALTSEVLMVKGHQAMLFCEDTKQVDSQEEFERMQLELQNILELYDRACGDLVHLQKKVQSLSSECLEEALRVSAVLDREDMWRNIVAMEKVMLSEALKEVEVSKQVLAKEADERWKAELNADVESWKKLEIIDALFASDKRYRKYSREEIEFATEFFSDTKKIGEGGYGNVYRCTLDHTPVAIKVFRADASDRKQEFLREVEILSSLRHPHLVLLLAACPDNGSLVYEYMENGSLEERLFCKNGTPPLPWFVRFRIAFEVASGLAFLHNSKPEPIVHCDLKPGNILLDRNFISKIGDVGIAKLLSDVVPDSVTEYRDSVIAGTFFYMDPEYHRTGTIRPKSDVYAFGVVVLQLLTARHPKGLIVDVENAINSGRFADILDKSISDWPLAESVELACIALKCSKQRCRDRPDLEYEVLPVLKKLNSTAASAFQLQKESSYAPNHYFCPILQEIMSDPHIAADGFTYEYGAIKAWLEKYCVSPVTGVQLPHTMLTPNKTLLSSIQDWTQRTTFPSSLTLKDEQF